MASDHVPPTAEELLNAIGAPKTACGGEGDAEVVLNVFERMRWVKRELASLRDRLAAVEALADELEGVSRAIDTLPKGEPGSWAVVAVRADCARAGADAYSLRRILAGEGK